MTPQAFIAKWGPGGPAFSLNEEQGAQSHFIDLCDLLGVPRPGTEAGYLFEQGGRIAGQSGGYADVYKRGAFAWENKAPGKNLDAALRQLLGYTLALDNPPLLVVCDRLNIRIHTQFNGHPSERHDIALAELEQHDRRELLRRVWTAPESFRPRTTNRDITEAAARSFATLAERLRQRGHHPDTVAHFLTQCLFCCFAEDVGLLPGKLFDRLIHAKSMAAERLGQNLGKLFEAMRDGGLFGVDDVPWFNGGLFQTIEVPLLQDMDVAELRNAAAKDWSAIDVSIFGTLFERGLDPAKRSQLGAHYTDPATIERIIDPVVRRPLLREWAAVKAKLAERLHKSKRRDDKAWREALALHVGFLQRLAAFRVLDPACGSGNFLYLALKCLKDVEHLVNTEAEALGLDRQVELSTGPANVLGIELNEYAAELARVTVWIGELQWRLDHGYPFKTNPVLEPLDHIENRDALLVWADGVGDAAGGPGADGSRVPEDPDIAASTRPARRATEAPWPRADAVVGNPPFLGDRKMIRELGEAYTETLRQTYEGRVPGGADLVCYWFEKARAQIAAGQLNAAGLVATNSIRGGANRKVLDAIAGSTRILEAWSDEPWVNEGAAVRVSLVTFGQSDQQAVLNGAEVPGIAADLSAKGAAASNDLTHAQKLPENADASFIGTQKNGPFDIEGDVARAWLRLPNPNGKSNALVVRPWANGLDVTRRPQDRWVVDFGCDMRLEAASLYETPFAHVFEHVKPTRESVRRDWHRTHWWLFGDARPGLRQKLAPLSRFVVTPMVAKHRVLAWMPAVQIPENLCVAVARADDTTFGILHSRFHELWSLRKGTFLGVGNDPRYTPTTCFETFPFPAGLTPVDTAHQQTEPVPGSAHGACIPAGLPDEPATEAGRAALAGAMAEPPGGRDRPSAPLAPPSEHPTPNGQPDSSTRQHATAIAEAAARLNALREAWLNPPEWTERVPEVTPLGMDRSPYPDRIVPRPGLSEADAKALQKRTLTNLYNQRPAWLAMAHEALDQAVARAYGWHDYSPQTSDDDILARLLALNLQSAGRS
ncbi:DNA methyltransferase [Hydrogenophaga sp.]|uniref:class I SAM-dependent DNA methyltransferase n=1 Tax=Hydrogenophaga sp. TaxID=1904254 RepID=UPI002CD6F469|nr:DNA methyltransferase [Hydrogenophaga sp.]HMP09551.1 hypothetical protein [Hydrogenophaga sp.]